MMPLWLEGLGWTVTVIGLLLAGTAAHWIVRTLDEAFPPTPATWTGAPPRGVRLLVQRPAPRAPKGRSRLECLTSGLHPNATRHPLGGFKCPDCGQAGADGSGYVTKRSDW